MQESSKTGRKQNIWQYEYFISRRLIWWAAISFSLGVPLIFMEPALRGFGTLAIVWGLINAALAVGGSYLTTRRYKSHTTPSTPAVIIHEAGKLRKMLSLGIVAGAVFLVAGIVVAIWLGRRDAWWMGAGLGLILQNLVIAGFDGFHLRGIPRT